MPWTLLKRLLRLDSNYINNKVDDFMYTQLKHQKSSHKWRTFLIGRALLFYIHFPVMPRVFNKMN